MKKCGHTQEPPRGYLNWVVYAEHMSKTHRQERCRFCGLWAIWVPKPPKATKSAVKKVLASLMKGAQP